MNCCLNCLLCDKLVRYNATHYHRIHQQMWTERNVLKIDMEVVVCDLE